MKIAAVFGGIILVAWVFVLIRDIVPRDDLKFLVIAVPISLVAIGLGLWASFFLAVSAIKFWQMTIIFVLLGGFMGGGLGALVGAALSGGTGLIVHKLADRY